MSVREVDNKESYTSNSNDLELLLNLKWHVDKRIRMNALHNYIKRFCEIVNFTVLDPNSI